MSLPLGWRGWDIPWTLLCLVPKGLTPIPEGFAPFLQLGQAWGTSASWKGVEILQRFSPSLIFYPPLQHPCGCPHSQLLLQCWSLSKKKPCTVGFTQPKKIQTLPPKLSKSPFLPNLVFLQPAPYGDLGREALPTALAAARALCDGNWMPWGSGVGFGGL